MGLCPKPRGLYRLDTKKGKIKRGKWILKIPPFLYIITLLLLVAPQRCHIRSSDTIYYIVY